MRYYLAALVLAVSALFVASVPPCATEDSTYCYWDAQSQGNGQGESFISNGTADDPVSPFTMGDANPNHEMLGPWPCPQISPGVCATPQQIADEPDGTDQP